MPLRTFRSQVTVAAQRSCTAAGAAPLVVLAHSVLCLVHLSIRGYSMDMTCTYSHMPATRDVCPKANSHMKMTKLLSDRGEGAGKHQRVCVRRPELWVISKRLLQMHECCLQATCFSQQAAETT